MHEHLRGQKQSVLIHKKINKKKTYYSAGVRKGKIIYKI